MSIKPKQVSPVYRVAQVIFAIFGILVVITMIKNTMQPTESEQQLQNSNAEIQKQLCVVNPKKEGCN